MIRPQKVAFVYIIGNIVVNTQLILKIQTPKHNAFNGLYIEINIITILSHECQGRSQFG